jgi:cyclic pyranopterin phosphate synthase
MLKTPDIENPKLVDPYGRTVDYLRISVTDRCDFRCVYCMTENMTFLPKKDLLSIEELGRLADVFIEKGVRKIRISGGEPLVRRGIMDLFNHLGKHLKTGKLDEVTLTTNGSQLTKFADDLYGAGVRRINLSLDTLDEEKFVAITRRGKLAQVMAGIDAAQKAGIKLKINAVALKGINEDEFDDMIRFCGDRGMDLTFIETMPMGDMEEDRNDKYLPLIAVKEALQKRWTLSDSSHRTGGPSRYMDVAETGGRLGFIAPLTHNFCEGCNRVRVTCTGQLYLCLGQDDKADLREPLRASEGNVLLSAAIDEAIGRKPKGHNFVIDRNTNAPAVSRHMNVTGG